MANGVLEYPNGGLKLQNPSGDATTAVKKSRESERRRRRKQKKKNNKASQQQQPAAAADDSGTDEDDSAKENGDPQKAMEQVEVEYVPEKAELYGDFDEEF